MYCDRCGEEPDFTLEQCPRCGLALCERCWGDRTLEICSRCAQPLNYVDTSSSVIGRIYIYDQGVLGWPNEMH